MKRAALKGELVAVWWTDAQASAGPVDVAEAQEQQGLPMLSVGLLIKDDDSIVTFAQDYYRLHDGVSQRERVRDISTIPKAYIQKMRKWKT